MILGLCARSGLRPALMLLALAPTAHADEQSVFGFRRAAFLARPVGARGPGMGEAFTAVADDATALHWNPGGLGQVRRINAVAMYDLAGPGMALSYGALASPAFAGVAAIGVTALTYGELELRNADGLKLGAHAPMDTAVALGWAGSNPGALGGWTGVAGTLIRDVGDETTWAVTAGSLVPVSEALTLAVALQHLSIATDGFLPPVTLKLGGTARPASMIRFAADFGYGIAEKDWTVAGGAEANLAGLLFGRAGYKTQGRAQALRGLAGLALGGGLAWRGLALDYAYRPFGDLAQNHAVALGYALALPERPLAPESTAASDAEASYHEAQRAFEVARYDEALRLARAAVQADPEHWQAWQLLGNCRHAKRDTSGAIEAYQRSLAIHPDNPGLREFIEKLSVPPAEAAPRAPSAEALYMESNELYQAKRYEEAWAKSAEALKADPSYWQAWQMIGNCQHMRGDTMGAVTSYRRSLELHPDNPSLTEFIRAVAPSPGTTQSALNVAVAELSPQGVSASDSSVVTDLLRTDLVNSGTLRVVERQRMQQVLAEQVFQQTGCTSEECAIKLGKVLNVQRMVIGSYGTLGSSLIVNVRIVDVESGRIVVADKAEAQDTSSLPEAVRALAARLATSLR